MEGLFTLGDFGRKKLTAICQGIEFSPTQTKAAFNLFDLMSASWAGWPLGDIPMWRTNLSDDNTPFEFSLEFRANEIKLRILVESQQMPLTASSSWEAGLQLNQRLTLQPEVDLTKFNMIQDLFYPLKKTRFAIWHAAVLDAKGKVTFKVYLNPQIHGEKAAPELIKEAFTRLNLAQAWDFLAAKLQAAEGRSKLAFFSLDLIPDEHARVKVYLANSLMTLKEFDFQLKGSRNYVAGADINWIQSLTGIHDALDARSIVNYFAFTAGDNGTPISNIQVPIRWYVENDAEALARTQALLPQQQSKKLISVINKMASRSLEANRGLLAHVAIRHEKDGMCVIPYLSAEAYGVL